MEVEVLVEVRRYRVLVEEKVVMEVGIQGLLNSA